MMTLRPLNKIFSSRDDLIAHVRSISPTAGEGGAGAMTGQQSALHAALAQLDPAAYGKTRNFLHGKVTRLSPYIRHGMVSLNHVRNLALARVTRKSDAEKLIQELGWREFYRMVQSHHPSRIWADVEPYKTGFSPSDYADELPEDIAESATGVQAIDDIIAMLKTDGYLHNHLRMYLASYVVHWRQVKWQAGARFMLSHLIDADHASNNLSWQWIASTYSSKPYIFNLENMQKYCGQQINTSADANATLNDSYDELSARLFPHMESF